MKRLFLDANVLFTAAHNPNGKAAFLITLGRAGLFQLVTSPYAREEACRNLARKYPDCLNSFEIILGNIRLVKATSALPCPAGLPEKDCPIYLAAHACKADVLLTGDLRDFGHLMHSPDLTNGLLIQTVADFPNDCQDCTAP